MSNPGVSSAPTPTPVPSTSNTQEPNKAPIVILLSSVIAAFVAGVTAFIFLQQQIDSRVESVLLTMKDKGTLPPGPQGLQGLKGDPGPGPCPAGVILPFGGDLSLIQKNEWLPCDGRSLQVSEFRELYRAVGTSFGGERDVYFNLPDLRGRFLRGIDDGKGRDPDAKSRSESAKGGNTGDKIGSLQLDATRIPRAGFSLTKSGDHSHTFPLGGADTDKSTAAGGAKPIKDKSGETRSSGEHIHAISGGDAETRPQNIAVQWIIRVK